MELRVFKPGTMTPEEIEYEKHFVKVATLCEEHNSRKNYNLPITKKYKIATTRKHIPIYRVDIKTKEILEEFYSINAAGKSINMAGCNFSAMMIDRPIYKPVLIKGKWFIKQSHYEHWKNNNN